MSITTFTKFREPIPNSQITQIAISDLDDIFLLSDSGAVYRSENMTSVVEIRFVEINFPGNDEKVIKMAPGLAFISIMTESRRCFSLLDDDKENLVESGKLIELDVVDICAGARHVLVSTMLKSDENGNGQDPILNKTYTISFQKITEMGSGADNADNYQAPCENIKSSKMIERLSRVKSDEDKNSLVDIDESIHGNNGSRATTLECKDTESSNHSSAQKRSTTDKPNSAIRFIDNGIEHKSCEFIDFLC